MVFQEDLSMCEDFRCSAEPSAVQYGPVNVAWSIDPADAARAFINTVDLVNALGMLASHEPATHEIQADTPAFV